MCAPRPSESHSLPFPRPRGLHPAVGISGLLCTPPLLGGVSRPLEGRGQ